MLSLSVGNQPLDISDDIAITLKFMSPLFNDIGDYSYPFKLPLTSRNKMVLNWKHKVENASDKYEFFRTSVLWSGIELFAGSLRIQRAGQYYEAVLYVDKGSFNWESGAIKLHEMNLGVQLIPNTTDPLYFYNSTLFKVYPQTNFAFPYIENEMFLGTSQSDPELGCYNYNYQYAPLGLRPYTDHGDPSILVPFLFLRFLLQRVFSLMGYTLSDQFFTKSNELANLLIYNSWNLDENQINGTLTPGAIYYQHHVPRVMVNVFIHGLEKYFNCRFFVNDLRKTITIRGAADILKSPQVIPFSSEVTEMTVLVANKITGVSLTMKPDEGDSWFMERIQWEQEDLVEWTGTVNAFSDLSIPPISNIAMIGDVYYVIEDDKYYTATMSSNGYTLIWTQLYQAIVTSTIFNYRYQGPNLLKIETEFSNLSEDPPGTIPGCWNLKTDWKKISPRLVFGVIGPYGIKAHSSDSVFSLNFNGPHGIFNQFYKAWFDWIIDTRTNVEFKKQLSFMDIRDLDFMAKHEIDGNKYLLSSVSVSLTKTTIKPAIINAYSCF